MNDTDKKSGKGEENCEGVTFYQNMEKKDEEHKEQGMNHALTEARPSESAELKDQVNLQN